MKSLATIAASLAVVAFAQLAAADALPPPCMGKNKGDACSDFTVTNGTCQPDPHCSTDPSACLQCAADTGTGGGGGAGGSGSTSSSATGGGNANGGGCAVAFGLDGRSSAAIVFGLLAAVPLVRRRRRS